jgi:Glycosyl transferase family 2
MTGPTTGILLVTPVWNDSTRLAGFGPDLATALAARPLPLPIHWVIADDGSDGDEPARLAALRDAFATVFPAVSVHLAATHRGKGAVVREAWTLSPQAAWLAFVDADGSVTADDLIDLIARALDTGHSVLGVRVRTAQTTVVESPWRGLAHRGFLAATRILLGLRSQDPQCGAKVIRGDHYRAIAPRLREPGLAFDSELLASLAASGARWSEVPVNWTEKPGGKVKPLRDAWGMLAALLRVRRNLRGTTVAVNL